SIFFYFLSWKSMQSILLNTLTYRTSIVKKLWNLLVYTVELKELEKTGEISMDSRNNFLSILNLFSKCYSHALLTMDDDEFFQQQKYFSLSELTNMVAVL